MLDMKFLREQPDFLRKVLVDRNQKGVDLDKILEKEASRRALLHEVEQLRATQNRESEKIAGLKRAKEDAELSGLKVAIRPGLLTHSK